MVNNRVNNVDWMYLRVESIQCPLRNSIYIDIILFSFHWDNCGKNLSDFHYYLQIHELNSRLTQSDLVSTVNCVSKTQKLAQVVLHKVWFKAHILDIMNHIQTTNSNNHSKLLAYEELNTIPETEIVLIFSMIGHIFSSRFF